jgi:hypothetical protein
VVARPCEARWELEFSGIVCMASVWINGLRGKKITPSVRWEVPGEVSSVGKWELDGARTRVGKLASWMECAWENDFKLFAFGYGMHVYIMY